MLTNGTLSDTLRQLHEHQQETLRVHGEYIAHQREFMQSFFQFMQQQQQLLLQPQQPVTSDVINGLHNSAQMLHEHQAETLRVHAAYLDSQTARARDLLATIQRTPTAAAAAPAASTATTANTATAASTAASTATAAPAPSNGNGHAAPAPAAPVAPVAQAIAASPAAAALNTAQLDAVMSALLAIVADKTGYPVEMLEPTMELEADLGIDSIKRVEILSALQEQFPDLPRFKPDELADLRTIGEIGNQMLATVAAAPAASTAPAPPATTAPAPSNGNGHAAPVAPVAQAIAASPAAAALNTAQLDAVMSALLAIVADKTGYPVEMLEPTMELEADLGIDSIKRVEILSALQEQFPDLPRFKPDELADLRTIGEIGNQMLATVAAAPAAPAPSNGNGHAAPVPAATLPRGVAQLEQLPAPDFLHIALPDGGIALLTDDGTALTAHVASELTRLGWRVVVLGLPAIAARATLPAGVSRVEQPDQSEVTLQHTLQTIRTTHGSIAAFIHLHPAHTTTTLDFAAHEKQLVQQVFLLAGQLKADLEQATHRGHALFATVTRLDGAFGLGDDGTFGVIGGGLPGLTKTVNMEWADVACRAVDLSPTLTPEQAAIFLVAELHDPNRLVTEVAYGSHGRVTVINSLVEA